MCQNGPWVWRKTVRQGRQGSRPDTQVARVVPWLSSRPDLIRETDDAFASHPRTLYIGGRRYPCLGLLGPPVRSLASEGRRSMVDARGGSMVYLKTLVRPRKPVDQLAGRSACEHLLRITPHDPASKYLSLDMAQPATTYSSYRPTSTPSPDSSVNMVRSSSAEPAKTTKRKGMYLSKRRLSSTRV